MTNKLFVAGLPYSVTDEQLGEHFASAGTVTSSKVITDRDTGRSKGFGFVEMSSEEEAKKAMETMDGTDFGGRNILVKEAKPMEPRPERSGGFGGGHSGGNRDYKSSNRGGDRGGDRGDRRGGNRW
jgi:RNA recognition motif-containing protein